MDLERYNELNRKVMELMREREEECDRVLLDALEAAIVRKDIEEIIMIKLMINIFK